MVLFPSQMQMCLSLQMIITSFALGWWFYNWILNVDHDNGFPVFYWQCFKTGPYGLKILSWNSYVKFFHSFKKIFGRHKPLLWGHWYLCFWLLVTSPLGFKARLDSLICSWWRCTWCMSPEIHLWCDTCQPLDTQHGGQSLFTCELKWGSY